MSDNIKILIASHKPFKVPDGDSFQPIHVGREIAQALSKDGKISDKDYQWLLDNMIGDNDGDNISDKNRYYSECSALYWAWKNYDKLGNPDYIGLMHYRRHFIFNDEYYETRSKNKWENALGFVSEMFINDEYLEKIGLNDENIQLVCENYDLVVSKDARLDLIDRRNLRDDYVNTIPGVKVKDFDLMVDIVCRDYPEYKSVVEKNINGYLKSLYQMFIMKRDMFFEYCEFLFDVLFKIEQTINFEEYSTNGKRTLGYLAEDLLSMFVWKKEEEHKKILKLGVTMVEFPYEKDEISALLEKGCPSYFDYLKLKLKAVFLKKEAKQTIKERYQSIRQQRKSYKKLKKALSEVTNEN
ncbi:MAG: DUF4422 domain-containing protein [Candidatus Gastranaerophilales bacterium]|nr:DUF4422 domain-containing protein [Candidatus Gastranaerophilales bacterium]